MSLLGRPTDERSDEEKLRDELLLEACVNRCQVPGQEGADPEEETPALPWLSDLFGRFGGRR